MKLSDLKSESLKLQKEVVILRLKINAGKFEKSSEYKSKRRNLARIYTFISQKEEKQDE